MKTPTPRLPFRRRAQRGQSLVEFAIVANLLILLVFGIIQFGILYNNYVEVTDAARAAARQVSVCASGCTINGTTYTAQTAANTAALNSMSNLDKSKFGANAATVTWPDSNTNTGSRVQVTVSYPYKISLIGLPVWSGNLSATTQMRIE